MNYSFIIPHKNSSFLIKRLLKSIPQQDDIQIIIVDDNSSKKEIEALKNLSKDFVFELYTTNGYTAGGARNTGLKYAKGEWIIFADADDYFEDNLYVKINKYKTSDADIVYFDVKSRYSDTGEHAYRGEHINMLHTKYEETGIDDYLRCCHLAPWGKMIRKSLIEKHKILFEERIAGNDNWFSVNTGIMADKVVVVSDCLYCITVVSGSLTTVLNIERFESKFQSTLKTNEFLRKHHKNRYQISILYFLLGGYQLGIKYFIHVISECIKHKANPFIGFGKLLHPKKAFSNRQNKKVVKDER